MNIHVILHYNVPIKEKTNKKQNNPIYVNGKNK